MSVQLGSAYGKVVIDGSGVRRGTDEAKAGVNSLSSSFGGLTTKLAAGSAVIGGVGVLLKKTFDLGEEGAKVLQTARSFETLMEEVGAAPDLLEQLSRASRGTISDMQLMSSTTTLLMGAQGELATSLASATPELMAMAMAAAKLNPALGDATFMYESLAKGIKRGSPMILDNLGIIVKVEEANRTYAESIGKVAEELTVEEQKIALLNAVLAQGETLMAQAGGTTESATDAYTQMGAAVSNTKDQFLAWLGEALEPAAKAVAILLQWEEKINGMLDEQNAALIENTNSYQEYLDRRTAALVVAGKMTEAQRQEILNWQQNKIVVDGVARGYGELSFAQAEVLYESGKIDADTYDLIKHFAELEENVTDAGASFNIMTAAEYDAAQRMAEVTEREEQLGRSAEYLERQLQGATEAMEDQAMTARELDQAMNDLQTIVGGPLREETENFTEQQDELAKKMAEVNAEIETLSGQTLTPEGQEELDGLRGDYEELSGQYAANAAAHEEATKRILFDLLTQRAAIDGLTSAELTVLTDIAQKFGLIDEQTAATISGFDDALSGLAEGGSVTEATNAILEIGEAAGVSATNTANAMNTIATGADTALAIETMNTLAGQVAAISGQHPVVFNVSVEGDDVPYITTPTQNNGTGDEAFGATGLDMTVPPGFSEPANPFFVGTSSGEHVTVTPEGESPAGGGATIQIVQNFYGAAEPRQVRQAANEGVLAAQRRRGAR